VRGVVAGLCALIGVLAGPFLATVIERVPERRSLRPLQGFRSGRVAGTTGAAAVLFAAVGARFGADWALPAYLVLAACLLTVSAIDLVHFRIPNLIVYPTLFVTIPIFFLAAATADGDWHTLREAALGGAGAWLALLVIHLISPRGMGFGDVRLAAVIGIHAGWLGLDHVVLAVFLGFLVAAVVGVALLASGRRGRRDPVPFGPFLATGALIAVLFGNTIIDWYRGS
jgi:leader peptidase (prepilin peptidase)/N-methyltransferase